MSKEIKLDKSSGEPDPGLPVLPRKFSAVIRPIVTDKGPEAALAMPAAYRGMIDPEFTLLAVRMVDLHFHIRSLVKW